ncbi:related to serine/threonine-protein kinase VPS15 [Zygosaccharomyces bailii]|nr:related to serine/threonine-protein kinase VPS15 [Zygosaccharomyces bailii]
MGAQLSLSAQTSPSIAIFSYIDVLDEVHYVSQLNSSRFLKTCKGLDPNGEIIIKVFIKPAEDYNLKKVQKAIEEEAMMLAPLPNALNFSKVIESNRAGYLIRQHLKSNLYDRLSSRPHLQNIELKFMTFQLLQALNDIHTLNITHGDIKTENILTTSWDWLILTDFSSAVKPVYLPEDNPGEFSFYFDTSKRRTCYLAPERFDSAQYLKTKGRAGPVTKEMDIFSMGCCIAEMYAEGRPLFNLSQLFKYKNDDYDVSGLLTEEIQSEPLRNLIMDMIQLDPRRRPSSRQLLKKYRGSFFPEYFYTFTYEYLRALSTFGTGTPTSGSIYAHTTIEDQLTVIDKCCEKIYAEFGKICASLGYKLDLNNEGERERDSHDWDLFFSFSVRLSDCGSLKLQDIQTNTAAIQEESILLFISYICHGLRHIASSNTKLRCIEMLTAFSQFLSDENKIDRVIPYLVTCFEDEYSNVQALAVQSLSQVLYTIKRVNHVNENFFLDYLFPRLKRLLQLSKQNTYVRMVLANCLGDLVTVADRFQELAYFSSSTNSQEGIVHGMESLEITSKQTKKLVQQIEDLVVTLLTDTETKVKMSLLANILPLCKFFGREKTNDVVLSHLITYLNDKDSSLRIKLIQSISGVAVLLGPITLEQYILPLLIQTITDPDELVVANVLQSLKDLCKTGLVEKRFFYDICTTISPLLLHPNNWIRQFSLLLIVEISSKLTKAEVYCVLYPIVRPFFEFDVEFTYELMLSSCKSPVSRTVYNLLCSWLLRTSKSLFWQQVPNKHVDSFGNSSITFITKDYSSKNYGFNNVIKASNSTVRSFDKKEIPLTTEDKNWIDKFKAIGLPESDLWKIAILRGYVVRTAKLVARTREASLGNGKNNSKLENQASVTLANVMPRTVFFDVEFVESEDSTSPSVGDDLHLDYSGKGNKALPDVKDFDGSLMFNSKAIPTTTPSLKNIYVQLEPTSHHKEIPNHLLERPKVEPRLVIHNSYEGDAPTIKHFLSRITVLPSMKEYEEFGPVKTIFENTCIVKNINGLLSATLTENEPNAIVAMAAANGEIPYLITGTINGSIKLWDISRTASGEMYSSVHSKDLASTITDIAMLRGYDAFCISTKEGSLSVVRVLLQQRKLTGFQTIRRVTINEISKDEFAIGVKTVLTDDKAYLFALTNTSKLVVYDIRTMDCISTVESPVSHGAACSFVPDEQGDVLIVGTTKGIIEVWDMRFKLLIKCWTFGDHTPITHLEKCNALGKNCIVVAGGSTEAVLSIWNYCKGQCQQALINSDERPSVEHFLPIEKRLDEIVFSKASQKLQSVGSICVNGSRILVAGGNSNDIILIDVKDLASSRVLVAQEGWSSTFVPVQVTAHLTFLLKKNSHYQTPPTFCNDTINCLELVCTKNNTPLVVAADNSGVITYIN